MASLLPEPTPDSCTCACEHIFTLMKRHQGECSKFLNQKGADPLQPSISHLFVNEAQGIAIEALYNEQKTVYHEYTASTESQQCAKTFLELHALTAESLANLESRWTSVRTNSWAKKCRKLYQW